MAIIFTNNVAKPDSRDRIERLVTDVIGDLADKADWRVEIHYYGKSKHLSVHIYAPTISYNTFDMRHETLETIRPQLAEKIAWIKGVMGL